MLNQTARAESDVDMVTRVLNAFDRYDWDGDYASARLQPLQYPTRRWSLHQPLFYSTPTPAGFTIGRTFDLEPHIRSACVLSLEDVFDIAEGNLTLTVFRPQQYNCMELDANDFMFSDRRDDEEDRVGYFYTDGNNDAVSGSGCDRWFKLCPELVQLCAEIDEAARQQARHQAPMDENYHYSTDVGNHMLDQVAGVFGRYDPIGACRSP